MPSYAKFLKDILSNKCKLGDHETVMLTEECNARIQKKLPPKLKDPGSFIVPYTIGEIYFDKVFCDLDASINLMALSVFRKLGLEEAKAIEPDPSIQLPQNRSICLTMLATNYPSSFLVKEEERSIRKGEIEECVIKIELTIIETTTSFSI
ncbi:uncharacterized protein LOC111404705 [Olea europaea var. sylvestris]|uniref:uncharacterized protein LOC111404705 n=1 Tax=Olea europaea var. sylvestris TaxID=158386 RepID=UPI000C1CD101|nr:uncharacterized protein LOC111404705 [Olea europaea var. sylvestris]